MADKGAFPFDPQSFADMWKMPDMSKWLEQMKMPGIDPQPMMEHQKKNMDALMAANQAAAAGYQDVFKKQMAIFEETMQAAQEQMAQLGDMKPDNAAKQADVYRVAVDKALANMTELAETIKKSNEEVFGIMSARVKESIAELQALAQPKS